MSTLASIHNLEEKWTWEIELERQKRVKTRKSLD